jgi:hypothetical protein
MDKPLVTIDFGNGNPVYVQLTAMTRWQKWTRRLRRKPPFDFTNSQEIVFPGAGEVINPILSITLTDGTVITRRLFDDANLWGGESERFVIP